MANWKTNSLAAYEESVKNSERIVREGRTINLAGLANKLEKFGIPRDEMVLDIDANVIRVDVYTFDRIGENIRLVTKCARCGEMIKASDSIFSDYSLGKALAGYDDYVDYAHICTQPAFNSVEENVALVMKFITDMLIDRGWHVDSAYGRVDLNVIENFARSYYWEAINGKSR